MASASGKFCVESAVDESTTEKAEGDDEISDGEEDDDDEISDEEDVPNDIYEVEEILGIKKQKGKTVYLVRWKGWGPKHDSWEPEENMVSSMCLVEEYIEKKKGCSHRRKIVKPKEPSPSREKRVEETVTSFYEQLRKEEIGRLTPGSVDPTSIQEAKHAKEAGYDLHVKRTAIETKHDKSGLSAKKPKPNEIGGNEKPNKKKIVVVSAISSKADALLKENSGNYFSSTSTASSNVGTTSSTSATSRNVGTTSSTSATSSNVGTASSNGSLQNKPSAMGVSIASSAAISSPILKADHDEAGTGQEMDEKKCNNEAISGGPSKTLQYEDISEDEGKNEGNVFDQSEEAEDATEVVNVESVVTHPPKISGEARLELLKAVLAFDAAKVKQLFQNCAPDQRDILQVHPIGLTLLNQCAKRQDVAGQNQCRIIELLIMNGANMEIPDIYNRTPLFWLCKQGSVCCFKTFLKFQPHLDAADNNGETALFAAVRRKYPVIVGSLIMKGACSTVKNKRGQTVLDVIDEEMRINPDSTDILETIRSWVQNFNKGLESAFKRQVLSAGGQALKVLHPVSDVRWFSCDGNWDECTWNQLSFDLEKAPASDEIIVLFAFNLRAKPGGFEIKLAPMDDKPIIESVQLVLDGRGPGKEVMNRFVNCIDASAPTSPKIVFMLHKLIEKGNKVVIRTGRQFMHGEAIIFQVHAAKVVRQIDIQVENKAVLVELKDLKIGEDGAKRNRNEDK